MIVVCCDMMYVMLRILWATSLCAVFLTSFYFIRYILLIGFSTENEICVHLLVCIFPIFCGR